MIVDSDVKSESNFLLSLTLRIQYLWWTIHFYVKLAELKNVR